MHQKKPPDPTIPQLFHEYPIQHQRQQVDPRSMLSSPNRACEALMALQSRQLEMITDYSRSSGVEQKNAMQLRYLASWNEQWHVFMSRLSRLGHCNLTSLLCNMLWVFTFGMLHTTEPLPLHINPHADSNGLHDETDRRRRLVNRFRELRHTVDTSCIILLPTSLLGSLWTESAPLSFKNRDMIHCASDVIFPSTSNW